MENDSKQKWANLLAKPLSKKELEKLCPDGSYRIVGETAREGSSRKFPPDAPRMLDGKGKRWVLLPPNTLGKLWRKAGYLPIADSTEEWVEVRKSPKPLIAAGLVALVLIAAAVAVALFLGSGVKLPDLDSRSKQYTAPQFDRPEGTDPDNIQIPGYTAWELPENTDLIKVPLVNAKGNPCYMKYTIKLKDSGEVLFESKLIPPGEAITEYRLNRTFTKGNYPITLKVDTYDLEDFEMSLNGAEVGTVIQVA